TSRYTSTFTLSPYTPLFRSDNGSKTLVATGAGPTPCPNTVFLGLRCPQELDHLQGMSFFFDWPYYNVDQTSLQLWALAEWSIHRSEERRVGKECRYSRCTTT